MLLDPLSLIILSIALYFVTGLACIIVSAVLGSRNKAKLQEIQRQFQFQQQPSVQQLPPRQPPFQG